jgi:hypothetical protein
MKRFVEDNGPKKESSQVSGARSYTGTEPIIMLNALTKVAETLMRKFRIAGGRSLSHEAIVRRLYGEVANKANYLEAEKLIAPDCPLHSNNTLIGRGPNTFVSTFGDLRRASPDLQWKIEKQLAEKDSVCDRTPFSVPLTMRVFV